jgi:hypothetical protein
MFKFFKTVGEAFIEARMAKARYDLALHLTETNSDFRGKSVGEVFTLLTNNSIKHSI